MTYIVSSGALNSTHSLTHCHANIAGALYRVSVETKRSAAGEVSVTVSVQKTMSSGGNGMTEVMARP